MVLAGADAVEKAEGNIAWLSWSEPQMFE